ncbi:hypothetical protein OH77DRAFT_1421897 [Trametes cingulata]|nr:hypothetical protein OH77DRAFT_1421897 [Trametes cingulata]
MLVVDGLQTGTDTTCEGADVAGGGEWVRVETTTTLELVCLPRSRSHAQISSPRPSAPVLLSSFPFPSPLWCSALGQDASRVLSLRASARPLCAWSSARDRRPSPASVPLLPLSALRSSASRLEHTPTSLCSRPLPSLVLSCSRLVVSRLRPPALPARAPSRSESGPARDPAHRRDCRLVAVEGFKEIGSVFGPSSR